MQKGGAGCITATANLIARDLKVVFKGANDTAQAAAVAKAQERIVAFRNLSNSYVQLPAIKAMIANLTGDDGWFALRPPLVALTQAERADLAAKLVAIGGMVPA